MYSSKTKHNESNCLVYGPFMPSSLETDRAYSIALEACK